MHMTIQTVCKICGALIEADRERILAGNRRPCDRCRGTERQAPACTACELCGRPLRAGKRTVCARCLGVSVA
jgi:hypothetical protein